MNSNIDNIQERSELLEDLIENIQSLCEKYIGEGTHLTLLIDIEHFNKLTINKDRKNTDITIVEDEGELYSLGDIRQYNLLEYAYDIYEFLISDDCKSQVEGNKMGLI